MLDKFFLSLAANSISKSSTPVIYHKHCINQLQKRHECTVCREACPKKAISCEKTIEINEELCEGCHICSGTCPAQCISQYRVFIKNDEASTGVSGTPDNSTVFINCQHSGSDSAGIKIPCLASFPWEFYAYFSCKSPVAIDTSKCKTCPLQAEVYVESIEQRLKLFWGDKYAEKILYDAVRPPAEFSRRDFFSLLKNSTLKAVVSLLPEDKNEDRGKLTAIFRKLLVSSLDANGEKKYGWLTWSLTEGCWGCGICEKLCPQKAIKTGEKDGQKVLTHNAFLCRNCSFCKKVCPEQCLTELVIYYATPANRFVYNPIRMKNCEKCGFPIKPDGPDKCSACKTKLSR